MSGPSRRAALIWPIVALTFGLLASGAVVWHASYAAFTATTTNGLNSWQAGTVVLASAPSSAVFSISGLKPGDSGTACVKVTYQGTLPATVKLYLTAADLTTSTATNLAQYLTLQVNEGTGNNADCGDFSAVPTNDYNPLGPADTAKTLAAFSATFAPDYVTSPISWTANPNDTRTYQFIWWLQDTNSAQGMQSSARFTWFATS
jgi:hypothetical protein